MTKQTSTIEERTAHEEILAWCRKELGRVMRSGTPPIAECRVIDLRRPASSEVIVEAPTWLECHAKLRDELAQ